MGQAFLSGNNTVLEFPSVLVDSKEEYTGSRVDFYIPEPHDGTYIVCASVSRTQVISTNGTAFTDLTYAIIANNEIVDQKSLGESDITITSSIATSGSVAGKLFIGVKPDIWNNDRIDSILVSVIIAKLLD